MMFAHQAPLLTLLGLGSITYAQSIFAISTSGGLSPSKTSSSAAVTHTITVGKANHVFVPDVVQANIGDIIEFQFFPQNHSVARAEYKYPCIPYEDTGRGKVGFFSGFQPVDAILSDPPVYTIRVNNTNPVFYYCTAPGSCVDFAMVGVINPNASVSLAIQQDLAKKSLYMLQPGEDFPAEASSSIASLAATATSTQAAVISSSSSHYSLSTGPIVGIAVGGAVALILALALFFLIDRTKKLKQQINRSPTFRTAPRTFGPRPFAFGPPASAPDTTYTGGTAFVPMQQLDVRYGHMSQRPDISPHTAELSEADMNELVSMRSMSPRSPFQEFGRVYNPHQSPPLDRSRSSKSQTEGPHEMFAPLRPPPE